MMKKMHKVDEKLTVLREQFREYYNNNLKTDYVAIEKIQYRYLSSFFGISLLFLFVDYLASISAIIFCAWFYIAIIILLVLHSYIVNFGFDFKLKKFRKTVACEPDFYKLYVMFVCVTFVGFCGIYDNWTNEFLIVWRSFVILFIYNKINMRFKSEIKSYLYNNKKVFKFLKSVTLLKSVRKNECDSVGYYLKNVELLPEFFNCFDSYNTDDGWKCKYSDIDFECAEQKLFIIKELGWSYLKGLFINIDLNKEEDVSIQCISKTYRYMLYLPLLIASVIVYYLFGYLYPIILAFINYDSEGIFIIGFVFLLIGGVISFFPIYTIYKEVKKRLAKRKDELEDPIFSKKWRVYVSDPIKARTILTPAFMDRMLNVSKLFKTKNFEFALKNKKLIISMRSKKDMFETVSLFRRADDVDRVFKVVEQFYSIFQIIDLLKLEGKDDEKNA